MTGTPRPDSVSTKRQRIAALARQAPEMAFTSLSHHIALDWLKEAYRLTRKDGAVGLDGQTAEAYAVNLEANLQSLLDRAKSGTYKAPPGRRVHIPKGKGNETRPIGIPTFEDKVLQRAVVMVLESVYEQDFLNCSYGFRPGRSPHLALQSFREQMMEMRGGWVVMWKTARDRFSRGLRAINQWCRTHRRQKLAVQRAALDKKPKGRYAYYGVTSNYAALLRFYKGVRRN